MSKDSFNELQNQALNTPISKNLMISAGAGSGKTKVLTEKIKRILVNKELNIDELLVLTFTDAASFEMKNRIIDATKKVDEDLATKLLSAQISTYDSFFSFLVRKYSLSLNINPSFQIVGDPLIKVEKNKIIAKVLDSYYLNKDKDFLSLIKLTCYKDDSNLTKLLFDLDEFLNTLSYKDENEFLNHYKYLDEEFICSFYDDLFIEIKKDFDEAYSEAFRYIDFNDNSLKDAGKKLIEGISDFFNDLKNKRDFSSFLNTFKSIDKITKRGNIKLGKDNKISYKIYSDFYDKYAYLKNYPSLEEAIDIAFKNKSANAFLLKIIKEVRNDLDAFKRINSSYTFNDIAKFSLKLLSDPKFIDIKKEISSTYKYILIDEYQDTNDIQEAFIESLKDYSTFFIVGDIKQSIYRFRNANPTLFSKRKERYKLDKEHSVMIPMNINYRSRKYLLDFNNTFFKANISSKEGGVEFSDEEKLLYDSNVDIYKEKDRDHSDDKIEFITPSRLFVESEGNDAKEECLLIIQDILKKKEEYGYNFSDFAILCKTKASFNIYRELFTEFGIPLNLKCDENIRDFTIILVIKSLLKTYIDFKENNNSEFKFDYASLARSYLFEISDEEIYKNIKEETYSESLIFKKMKDFVYLSNNMDFDLYELYLKLLDYFEVFNKLYKLGDINSNINKIEEFGSLISSLKNEGKTYLDLKEFLELIVKFDIELSTTNNIESNESVILSTIHASKGLEYKVVYIPLNETSFKNDSKKIKNISRDYGILYEGFEFGDYKKSLFDKCNADKDKDENKSEFIRLIYVAFTRPKEKLVFVKGNSGKANEVINLLNKAFNNKLSLDYSYFKYIKENYNLDINLDDLKSVEDFINCDFDKYDYGGENGISFKDEFNRFEKSIKDLISEIEKEYDCKLSNLNFDKISSDDLNKDNFKDIKNIVKTNLIRFINRVNKLIFLKTYKENKEKIEKELPKKISIKLYFLSKEKITKSNIDKNFFLTYFSFITGTDFYIYNSTYSGFKNTIIDKDSVRELKNLENKSLPEFKVSEEQVKFEERVNKRASHKIEIKEEDFYLSNLLKEGVHLHYLMELYDFKKKDLSYIKDEKEKEIISKVVNLDIFKDSDKAKVYKEYEYLDDNQKGSIDLLLVYDDHIDIIDYKTKNIDDEAYPRQLNIYKNNIFRLFKKDNIKMYLISLINAKVKEID